MNSWIIKLLIAFVSPMFCIVGLASSPRPMIIEKVSGERIIKSPVLVDSITFDFNWMDSEGNISPIQKIWEGGNSIDVFISEISSIEFNEINPVYKEDVILLENEIFNCLRKCVSDSILYFDKSIKKYYIPKMGSKLSTLKMTDKLPLGFMGRIEKVNETEDGVELTCVKLWYDEIYESFYGEFCNTPTNLQKETRSSTESLYENLIEFNPMNLEIKIDGGESTDDPLQMNSNCSININAQSTLNVRTAVLVESGNKVSITSNCNYNCDVSEYLDLCTEISYNRQFPILISYVPIPVAPLVQVYLNAGIDFNLNGKIGVKGSLEQSFKVVADICVSNYENIASGNSVKVIPISNNVNDILAYGNTEMKLGIYGELGVSLGKRGIADIGVKYENGVAFTIDAGITRSALENAASSTELYDLLSSKTNISLSRFSGFSISADLIKIPFLKLNLSLVKDAPFLTASFFPTFRQLNLNRRNEQHMVQLEGIMKRSMIKCTPRVAIFEKLEDGSVAQSWNKISNLDISDGLENLNLGEFKIKNREILENIDYVGKSWIIHPVINIGGYDILASQAIDITEKDIKASGFKVIYKNTIQQVNPGEQSATSCRLLLDVEIDELDMSYIPQFEDEQEWGIWVYLDSYHRNRNYSDYNIYLDNYKEDMKYGNYSFFKPLNKWHHGEHLTVENIMPELYYEVELEDNLVATDLYLTWGYYYLADVRLGTYKTYKMSTIDCDIPVKLYIEPIIEFKDVTYSRGQDGYDVNFKVYTKGLRLPGFKTLYAANEPSCGSYHSFFNQTYYYDDIALNKPTEKFENEIGHWTMQNFYICDGLHEGNFKIYDNCSLHKNCNSLMYGSKKTEYYNSSDYSYTSILRNVSSFALCCYVFLGDDDKFEYANTSKTLNTEHVYFELSQRIYSHYDKISDASIKNVLSRNLSFDIRKDHFPFWPYIYNNCVHYRYIF